MVRRRAEDGSYYHEPPYTWEEEQDFYARINAGPFTVLRGLLLRSQRRRKNRRRVRRKNSVVSCSHSSLDQGRSQLLPVLHTLAIV